MRPQPKYDPKKQKSTQLIKLLSDRVENWTRQRVRYHESGYEMIKYDMLTRCHPYKYRKSVKYNKRRHMDKVVFDVRVEHWLRKMSEKVC